MAAAASSHARFSFGIREGQPAGECCRCRMGTATQTVRQARGGRVETRRVSRQTLLSCDCERGRAGREKRGREADALHLVQLVVARGASCGDGGRILYRRRRDDPGPGRGSSPLAAPPSYVRASPAIPWGFSMRPAAPTHPCRAPSELPALSPAHSRCYRRQPCTGRFV